MFLLFQKAFSFNTHKENTTKMQTQTDIIKSIFRF